MHIQKVTQLHPDREPELDFNQRVEDLRLAREAKIRQAKHDHDLAVQAKDAAKRTYDRAASEERRSYDALRNVLSKNESVLVDDQLLSLNAHGGLEIKHVTIVRRR